MGSFKFSPLLLQSIKCILCFHLQRFFLLYIIFSFRSELIHTFFYYSSCKTTKENLLTCTCLASGKYIYIILKSMEKNKLFEKKKKKKKKKKKEREIIILIEKKNKKNYKKVR